MVFRLSTCADLEGVVRRAAHGRLALSIMLRLPGSEEREQFSDVYKREFGHLPKNFDRHQRAAKVAHQLANAADPYRLGLPSTTGGRSDYGQTRCIGR